MRYVNLGCGTRCHPAWTNIDLASTDPDVIVHDLSTGIPLPDSCCDVVYHSHMLEHLHRSDADRLIRDCFRVLRPGGVLRVAVPDLERLCRTYLQKLEEARAGGQAAEADYDWMMLELYDQTVREQSGGEMLLYLTQPALPNEAFVRDRIGDEGRALLKLFRDGGPAPRAQPRWTQRLRAAATFAQERAVRIFLGARAAHAWRIGQFRLAGEVHQWMYDSYSLGRLLKQAGFIEPIVQTAHTSRIPEWTSFHLDTLPDGTVCKPDSLFMEAGRPSGELPTTSAAV